MEQKPMARRFELDWLRVLAILTVFVAHCSRFFDPQGWHVKNARTYPGLEIVAGLFITWLMPLIFVISGASIFYSLRKGATRFMSDRVKRLLVPLVVGIFTHAMIGVMRAIGAENAAIMQVVIVEGVLIGLMNWVLSIVVAIPITQLLDNRLGTSLLTVPLVYTTSTIGIAVWLVVVLVLASVASALPARNATRLTVREVLAYE